MITKVICKQAILYTSMLNYLTEKYKDFTRQKYFDKAQSIKNKYAFVGTGRHAIAQLYPVLQYLGIPIKFICSKNIENAKAMCAIYKGAEPTDKLEKILEDKEIKAVFVCTNPQQHFTITKQLLTTGKHVFVEKPPCANIIELSELVKLQKSIFQVNFQQRYSPSIELLKSKVPGTKFYRHEYLTGIYNEGEPLLELFIHPLDILIYLFGDVSSFNCQKIIVGKAITYLILAKHNNGTVGEIKLSTAYSWQGASETLEMHTGKHVFTCNYPNLVKRTTMPLSVAGLPLEKVLKSGITEEILLNGNAIDTSFANHSSYLQGFFGSLNNFIRNVESKSPVVTNISDLQPLYIWIDALRKL